MGKEGLSYTDFGVTYRAPAGPSSMLILKSHRFGISEMSRAGGLKRGRNSREEEKDRIRRRERKKGNKETVI